MSKMEQKVSVKKITDTLYELTITVSPEEFDAALDKAFDKVINEIRVDGFRPGKMPKSLFINRFGWKTLYTDAVQFAINESYFDALTEVDVIPAEQPEIDFDFDKVEKGSGFTYIAKVETWGKVQLGEYKGIEVKPKSTKVTKKDIDAYVKNVLDSKTEIVLKDTAAESGDTVIIDFEGFIDGVPFEGGKGENHPLELGSNSFIPGFEDQLVGSVAGSEVDVNVVFPDNYHASLSGKAALFKVKVHEVKGKVYPELSDQLVEELEIAGVKTKTEYLEHVKQELTKQKEADAERHVMETIFKKITKNSKVNIPEVILNQEVEDEVSKVEQQAKQYGLPVEALLQYSGYGDLESFKQEARKNLKKKYTEDIIIDEIITAENIEVSDEEIENEYLEIAGDAKKVAEIKKQYKKEQVIYHIQMNKALKLLKESAVIL